MIPLKDCKKGYVYKIRARNFRVAVFDGKFGFIGIRQKFNDRYLFTEYHHEIGPPFGTVIPKEKLEAHYPGDMNAKRYGGDLFGFLEVIIKEGESHD